MDSSFNPAVPFISEVLPRKFPWVNVVLFLATCLSTLVVGTILAISFYQLDVKDAMHPSSLLMGLPFSIALMSILLSHEMGHYLTSRYYGIDASLPYFIPFPNLAGTMGAFIRIRTPFQNRASLLEVGIMGPIAGFVVAIVALVVSMSHARFVAVEPSQVEGSLRLGDPLILKLVEHFMGMTPPAGMDIYLHPVGFAAWFGFLVTALNLLPAAQLDGGHVTYALFRGRHRQISLGVVALLVPLAIFYWWVWGLWIVLLVVVLRLYHPPTLDDSIPLRPRHFALGLIALVMLVLCFTPVPIS